MVKLSDGKLFYEYSLDDIAGDMADLAGQIGEAFRLSAALTDQAVGKAHLADEPLVQSFSRPNDFADYTEAQLLDFCKEQCSALLSKSEHLLNAMVAVSTLEVSKLFVSEKRELDQNYTWVNGESMSVELYEQYNFGSLDLGDLREEIASKMAEVKARFEAVKPDYPLSGTVILNKLELADLFYNIASDLNFATVYSHSNLWSKGDAIQKDPQGDVIGITMAGQAEGSIRSSRFDNDGLSLGSVRIVDGGKAAAYYGSNRYGQYLGEIPTGELRCLLADAGTVSADSFASGKYLEVVSMSGLQVDFYNDYIGGEVRLAYYHDGERKVPVTGVSISGKLSQVLDKIRFSSETAVEGGYFGPAKAALEDMTIF